MEGDCIYKLCAQQAQHYVYVSNKVYSIHPFIFYHHLLSIAGLRQLTLLVDHTFTFTLMDNLEPSINLTHVFLESTVPRENPCRHQKC